MEMYSLALYIDIKSISKKVELITSLFLFAHGYIIIVRLGYRTNSVKRTYLKVPLSRDKNI